MPWHNPVTWRSVGIDRRTGQKDTDKKYERFEASTKGEFRKIGNAKSWKCQANPSGYVYVKPRCGNSRKHCSLSLGRAVALAHRSHERAPGQDFVDHMNHDTKDNSAANVRFVTTSQNNLNRDVSRTFEEPVFRFRPLTGEVLRTYPSLQAAADELEVLPPHVEQAAMWGHALPGFTFVRFGTTQGPRFGSWQLLTADHLRILCPGLSAAELARKAEHAPEVHVSRMGHVREWLGQWRLRPTWVKNGYNMITVLQQHVSVSHVVAAAYLPPQPTKGHVLAHIDGVRLNDAAENLEWMHPRDVKLASDKRRA